MRTKVGVLGVQGDIGDASQLESGRGAGEGSVRVLPGVEVELPDACTHIASQVRQSIVNIRLDQAHAHTCWLKLQALF